MTSVTGGRLVSGSGRGVVGSGGGVLGSGGGFVSSGADGSRVASSGGADSGFEYIVGVMGAWLYICMSGLGGGGVCKGGMYALRMWWCALRIILFPI